MESTILNTLGFLEIVNFGLIYNLLAAGFLIFWIVVVGWVWSDASERFNSYVFVVLSAAFVILFNIFGLMIYLIIRPKMTHEDAYWSDRERRFLKYESAGLSDCPECGCDVQPNFINCPKCGCVLRLMCKACDVYLEPWWEYCPFCGAPQKNAVVDKSMDLKQVKRKCKGLSREKFFAKISNFQKIIMDIRKKRKVAKILNKEKQKTKTIVKSDSESSKEATSKVKSKK